MRRLIVLGALSLMLFARPAAGAQEVADNDVDEDGDGFLAMTDGPSIRATHPRVIISATGLQEVLDRMSGPLAHEPYKGWFTLLKSAADGGAKVSMTGLALLYRATRQQSYLDTFVSRLSAAGVGLDALYGVDLIFEDLPLASKQALMVLAKAPGAFYYGSLSESQTTDYNLGWGYHDAMGLAPALAYSGIFALTAEEVNKDPSLSFDAANFLRLADHELSPSGHFWQIERRIAGDPTNNPGALPGEPGGMYDNFGYDGVEDSYGINLIAALATLKGTTTFLADFYHERYRGRFYQAMQVPYLFTQYPVDSWCYAKGSEPHKLATIWNTQTDYHTQPGGIPPMTATLFADGRMQYFVNHGTQPKLCGSPFNGLEFLLLYYDDLLDDDPPSTLPTASYFSGPGLTVTRSDWSNSAAFGVFIAGESMSAGGGTSRRYEDANSFLLGRNGHVVTHAGARIRFQPDNDKHHWYAIRSAAKNTLKIFDPHESFDLRSDGSTGPWHSGPALVASDNLGGQIFETGISNTDGCFQADSGTCRVPGFTRGGGIFPLGFYERANTIKFEHRPTQLTYVVGDARAAYSGKIDLFERELVHVLPNLFVLADRVRSVDPSFRKVWTAHTVDEPITACAVAASGQGMRSHDDCPELRLISERNHTFINAVWPAANRAVVRGGDTALVAAKPLSPATSIEAGAIVQPEIGRWLEILGSGSDPDGSLTIEGDADEGNGISENLAMSASRRQTENGDGARPSAVTATAVTDTSQAWKPGQWRNFMVEITCSGDIRRSAVIEDNSPTVLSVHFAAGPCSAYNYSIFRYVGNTTKHWRRIARLSTSDLNFAALTVSTPHYFDTTDVNGRVISFAPRTDQIGDSYKKRRDLGQWTMEIEARTPALLDNFLVTFSLADPGVSPPVVTRIDGDEVFGALIETTLVLFKKSEGTLGALQAHVPVADPVHLWLFDAAPSVDYGCTREGATVSCAPGRTGQWGQASTMGVVELTLPSTVLPDDEPPVEPQDDGGTDPGDGADGAEGAGDVAGGDGAGDVAGGDSAGDVDGAGGAHGANLVALSACACRGGSGGGSLVVGLLLAVGLRRRRHLARGRA